MIISVHLPKTAGRSFAAALRSRFGDALREDYASLPMNTPRDIRNAAALEESIRCADDDFHGVECIHGHFLPLKYSRLAARRDVTFVTWVRHPVERILSNYYYWKGTYQPETAPPLHRRMVEENWSIERFCLGDEMRNMYGQFLWGFPVEHFDFIGVTEYYDDDLAYFARRFLGRAVDAVTLNVGPVPAADYDVDAGLRHAIETFHDTDMALYERACRARRARERPGAER